MAESRGLGDVYKRQVQEADIILADEPVSALDPVTAQTVMNDFQRLNRELKRTIIMNIHSIPLARQYASRIIGMRSGEIVFDGPASLATDAKLSEIYGAEIFKNPSDELNDQDQQEDLLVDESVHEV